jgi:biotin carboxyl carrier protein
MLAAMNQSVRSYRVEVNQTQLRATSGEYGVVIDDESLSVSIGDGAGLRSFQGTLADGSTLPVYVEQGEGEHECIVYLGGEAVRVGIVTHRDERLQALRKNSANLASSAQIVHAPMPGLLKQMLVSEGEIVEKGRSLCILEAMKMENEIKSPGRLVVKRLIAMPGAAVEKGTPLMELRGDADPV